MKLLNGVADGTRTHDNRNHNPGLYQLSYSHRIACEYKRSGSPPGPDQGRAAPASAYFEAALAAAAALAASVSLLSTLKRVFKALK